MQRDMQTTRWAGSMGLAAAAMMGTALMTACQSQPAGGSGRTDRPSQIVIWEDPLDGGQGTAVRDANNDPERFVVIGTNGAVQFIPDGTVCSDCDTTDATIDVGEGNLIDIRFGVSSVGDDARRPFLVDRASGNFVQLIGGGSSNVTFQVTEEPLEDPNDSSDDLAIAAGTDANPQPNTGGTGGPLGSLCGAAGGILPLFAFCGIAMHIVRQRRRA